jgi:hypothetical protein
MGVHTGEAERRDGDYYGSEVNRAARLMGVAHGDQIVVSLATSALVRDGSVELIDLGEHRLRDLATLERVFQVCAPGLAREFPALRTVDATPGNLVRVDELRGPRRRGEGPDRAGALPASDADRVGGSAKTRLAVQSPRGLVASS